MTSNLLTMLDRMSPKLRSIYSKQLYQFLARSYQRKDWKFMNYGYAPLANQNRIIYLDKADEDNHFCIQLYDHAAGAVDLRDYKVLEVGSGRGGGADYIKRYLKPEIMIGVDISENAVRFCNENYHVKGLSFEAGNAESLPFSDNSFDVVMNVESSHCYSSMDAFLGQAKRVLREGGYFLLADFRRKEALEGLRESLNKSGLTLIKETDITLNIIEALKLDNERKTSLIKKSIHKPLVGLFLQFAGTNGSLIYERFVSGETIYLSYVLQKTY
ncbi:MAG: class I SAM-dependent methyltransferase [Anaerolineaceae bacterium]|nr:class I SAM-dependent methyltransferase [Anaerolineaceae bacterium]